MSNPVSDYVKAHPPGPFKPKPFYFVDGDILHWYWSEEPAYEQQVNVDGQAVGCLLRCMESHDIVGVKIFGAAEMTGLCRLREQVLQIVREQPFYPDTHTGLRQQWVKDQIASKIDSL